MKYFTFFPSYKSSKSVFYTYNTFQFILATLQVLNSYHIRHWRSRMTSHSHVWGVRWDGWNGWNVWGFSSHSISYSRRAAQICLQDRGRVPTDNRTPMHMWFPNFYLFHVCWSPIGPRPPSWRGTSQRHHQPPPPSFLENFNTEESTKKEN